MLRGNLIGKAMNEEALLDWTGAELADWGPPGFV
jgi:hypothetical protein